MVTQTQVTQLHNSNTETINSAISGQITTFLKMFGVDYNLMTSTQLSSMTNIIHSKIDETHGIVIVTFSNKYVISINY